MINCETSCLRKLRHESYLEALQHAAIVPNNGTVVVYGCEYCGAHHVGHSMIFRKVAKTEKRIACAKAALRGDDVPEIKVRDRQRIRDLEMHLARLRKQLQDTTHDLAEAA